MPPVVRDQRSRSRGEDDNNQAVPGRSCRCETRALRTVDRDGVRVRLRRHLRVLPRFRADFLNAALDGKVATMGFAVNQIVLTSFLLHRGITILMTTSYPM